MVDTLRQRQTLEREQRIRRDNAQCRKDFGNWFYDSTSAERQDVDFLLTVIDELRERLKRKGKKDGG